MASDDGIAELLSLLENSVSEDAARDALKRAGGSIPIAVNFIFNSTLAASQSQAPAVVVDLDGDSPSGPSPSAPAPAPAAGAAAAASSASLSSSKAWEPSLKRKASVGGAARPASLLSAPSFASTASSSSAAASSAAARGGGGGGGGAAAAAASEPQQKKLRPSYVSASGVGDMDSWDEMLDNFFGDSDEDSSFPVPYAARAKAKAALDRGWGSGSASTSRFGSASSQPAPKAGAAAAKAKALAATKLSKSSSSSRLGKSAGTWKTTGYDEAPADTWKDVDLMDESGLGKWHEDVIFTKDPPSMTLNGPQVEELETESDGRMHLDGYGFKASQIKYNKETKLFSVAREPLKKGFMGLLEKVRYPVAKMEFSWRVVPKYLEGGRTPKLVPEDLAGPLPQKPFRLLDNRNDTPAPQPPNFQRHMLRPEQLRSLAWMLDREGHSPHAEQGQEEPFIVEWRRFYNPDALDIESDSQDYLVPEAPVRLRDPEKSTVYWGGTSSKTPVSAPSSVGILKHVDRAAGRATVAFSTGLLSCAVGDLDFAEGASEGGVEDGFAPGSKVKVSDAVQTPSFGWGGVTRDMVGTVVRVESEIIVVKYQNHQSWKGKKSEMVQVKSGPTGALARPKCVVELRIRADFNSCGGILADKVGYGKTATTIGLIDATLHKELPPIPEWEKERFFPAKGTLIILPSNLYEQWLTEIGKFLLNFELAPKNFRLGWSPANCPLKIFAMSNVTPLTKAKVEDISNADIVVCSYRLLFSQVYQARRKELAGDSTTLKALVAQTRKLIRGEGSIRSGRKGTDHAHTAEELVFPVLEQFFWKRVVFDEFHELESFEGTQQNSLQHLRAHFRWGLTGTPPVETSADVIFLSSLFRIDLPGYLHTSGVRIEGNDLLEWESDRLVGESAARFLDQYARQNTAVLPHIRIEEHVVHVEHTTSERALYLGQAYDAPDVNDPQAFQTAANVQALERLLKLCSHFQAAGDHVASAKDECFRISEQKERRVLKARNQISRCARVQLVLEAMFLKAEGKVQQRRWRNALAAAEKKLLKEDDQTSKDVRGFVAEVALESLHLRLEGLDPHRPRDEALLKHMRPMDDPRRGFIDQWRAFLAVELPAKELELLLTNQAKEQADNLQEYFDAVASREFFQKTVRALANDEADTSTRSCSICLDENLSVNQIAITPCAHSFCLPCLEAAVQKFGKCSLCQQPLTKKDVRPLSQELKSMKAEETAAASAAAAAAADAAAGSSSASGSGCGSGPASSSSGPASAAGGGTTASSSSSSSSAPAAAAASAPKGDAIRLEDGSEYGKYGTKLFALVHKLWELRRQDPSAKVILFVQFDDLKRKVASALMEFGIPTVQLAGAVTQRAAVIRDWQNNPTSHAFVLLLSLAQSASGTNLTAANHVVFLHPMLAPTPEKAVAHELQAIGRARRHGQQKDVVHVWRFVTRDSIEEAMTERHRTVLQAREAALQGNAAPAALDRLGDGGGGAAASAAAAAAPAAAPAAAAAGVAAPGAEGAAR